MKGAAVLA